MPAPVDEKSTPSNPATDNKWPNNCEFDGVFNKLGKSHQLRDEMRDGFTDPNMGERSRFVKSIAIVLRALLTCPEYASTELHTPFHFGPSTHDATEFQIDLLIEKVRYRYRVSYNAQRICSERLLVYKTGKAQRWFERRYDATSHAEAWTAFSPNFNGPREMWRKATRSRALFLTTAAHSSSEQMKPLAHWFEHCLDIMFPSEMTDLSHVAGNIQNADFKGRVLCLLRAVGITVDDVRIAESESSLRDAATVSAGAMTHRPHSKDRPHLEVLHSANGCPPVWLVSEFEASGTHRLFGVIGPLLSAIETGKRLVIDDFDANLHPLIAGFLVRFVNDPTVSDCGAQLLLVSHNTTLMDLNMLRRDEIWLTELDDSHATRLSTMMQSGPRKHEHIAKGYLRGRCGAIPNIRPDSQVHLPRSA